MACRASLTAVLVVTMTEGSGEWQVAEHQLSRAHQLCVRLNIFPEISLPQVYAHTFFPTPSDLSCSAFSLHIFTSCWLQAAGMLLSSFVLSAFPCCSRFSGCLGIEAVFCLMGKDWASSSPATGRVWSGLGEFPVSLSVTIISEGEWDNSWDIPVQDLSLEWHLKPNMVFWREVAEGMCC